MAIDFGRYGEPVKDKPKVADFSRYGEVLGEAPPDVRQDGFFTSVYKSMFTPVVNLIARPGQLAQTIAGKEPSSGRVWGLEVTPPPQNRADVLRDVGRGMETVALGIGVGGAGGVARTGIKEGVKRGLKEGAVLGLKSSPVFGAGASLSQGNTDIRTILKDAAMTTAFGVPATAVLGGIVPGISGVAKSFTQDSVRDSLGNVYRDTASQYVKPQTILDNAQHIKKTDPVAVLQMYGKNTLPTMKGGGADTTEGQLFLKKKIGELSNLRNEELFLSDERVPLAGYYKYADEMIDAQGWSATKKANVRRDVQKIFREIDTAYADSPKNKNGIDLNEMTLIKSEQTALSKSYNNPSARFDYDAHAIAGKAARDLVELLSDSPTVRDLNKLIESHYDAIDFLDALSGKKVHGGALSKMFFKLGGDIVGVAAGSAAGSPIAGAAVGHVVASKVADIVQSRFITNPIKRLLINNLSEQSPKEVVAALKSLESKYGEIFADMFPDGVGYLSKTSKNTSPMTAPATSASKISINDIVPRVGAKSKVLDLKTPSPRVVATKGITKTPEIRRVESAIAKNVEQQKAAIRAKDYKLVEKLKQIYAKLVELLKAEIARIKKEGNRGFIRVGGPKADTPRGKGKEVTPPSKNTTTKGGGVQVYAGEKDLTTKFLEYAKGKTTLSRQEILDFARRPELKKGEADLLLKKLEEFEPKGTKVLHGTAEKFDAFDDTMRGSITGAKSGKGAIWFTDDPATAKAYSVYASETGPINKLLEQQKTLERIAQKSGKESDWAKVDEITKQVEELDKYEATYQRRLANANVKEAVVDGDFMKVDAKGKSPQELSAEGDIDSWLNEQLDKARKLGKDGVVFQNLDDAVGLSNRPATHYAIFDSSKAKLTSSKLPAQDFADSIRRDLLELKPVKVKEPQYERISIDKYDVDSPVPTKARTRPSNYEEVVFESPITTNGSSHFPNSKNYFAHARGDEVVEGGKKIWREQEIQSDIVQREGIDRSVKQAKTSLLESLENQAGDLRAKFPDMKITDIMEYIEKCL